MSGAEKKPETYTPSKTTAVSAAQNKLNEAISMLAGTKRLLEEAWLFAGMESRTVERINIAMAFVWTARSVIFDRIEEAFHQGADGMKALAKFRAQDAQAARVQSAVERLEQHRAVARTPDETALARDPKLQQAVVETLTKAFTKKSDG